MDCAYFRASAIARTVPVTMYLARSPVFHIYTNGTRKRTTSMEHFGTYEDLTGNPGRRLGEEEHAHRRDLVCVRAPDRFRNTRFPDGHMKRKKGIRLSVNKPERETRLFYSS
jgi:hypothetical protein